MALNQFKFGVGFVLGVKDQATAGFRSVGSAFTRMTRNIMVQSKKLRVGMSALALGAPLLLAGKTAIAGLGALSTAAGQYEQGLAAVGAVTRATSEELGMLSNAAIEAGIKTQFSPTEAVEGLKSLATAGQTARQAVQTLVPVLDLAAGSMGQLGVARAADAVVGTLNAYGMAADKAGIVTDKLLRITQLTNFQTRDFGVGLSKSAAMGATFGQSLNDILILMGLLRNRNIDASSASTAVREATRRLGADFGAQQKLIQKGIKIYDAQTGRMRSVMDITLDLAEASKDWTEKERNRIVAQVYGARGLLAFNAVAKATVTTMEGGVQVTKAQRDAVEALRGQMNKTIGTSEEFRRKLLATFEGQKTLLRGTLQTMAVVFGRPLTKLLAPIVNVIVNIGNAIIRLWQKIPQPIQKGILAFAAFGAALTAIVGGVVVFTAVIGLMGITLGGVLVTLGGVLVAIPLVTAAFGGIAVAVYAAYKAFTKASGGMATSWADFVRQVRLAFQGAVAIIKGEPLSRALVDELNKAENRGVLRFLNGLRLFRERFVRFWTGLKAGFEHGVQRLSESSAMKRLMQTFQGVFGIFGGAEARNSEATLKRWGDAGVHLGGKLARMGELALSALNTVVDLGKAFATAMAGITAEDIKAGISGLIEVFQTFHSVLSGIATVAGVIKKAFMIMYRVIRTVGAGIGEIGALIVKNMDFVGSARVKRELPAYRHFEALGAEARGLAGEFGVQPLGLGQTTAEISQQITAENSAIDEIKLRAMRRGAVSLLEQRQQSGGNVRQMLLVLEHIDAKLAEANKRRANMKIKIDAADLAGVLSDADERELDRAAGELPVAAAF